VRLHHTFRHTLSVLIPAARGRGRSRRPSLEQEPRADGLVPGARHGRQGRLRGGIPQRSARAGDRPPGGWRMARPARASRGRRTTSGPTMWWICRHGMKASTALRGRVSVRRGQMLTGNMWNLTW